MKSISINNSCTIAFAVMLALFFSTPSIASHGNPVDIQSRDIAVGSGVEAAPYSTVSVSIDGWLQDGTQIFSSKDSGPARFVIGAGQIIPGIELGLEDMRIGGIREIVIPPSLGFGSQGVSMGIPANAILRLELGLLAVEPPPFQSIGNQELQSMLEKGTKIIDIRRKEEWKETGVVSGSEKITAFDDRGRFLPSFMQNLEAKVNPDEAFIVICRTGNRTAALSNWLVTQGGYPNVINVNDGIVSWIESGRPVTKL